jgi:D-glycero-beta-D-manno-heptose-7-phosphate kinase
MKKQNLAALFKGKKVLIAGDIMLDSYIFGRVDRISPEAPVPVVAIERRENRPGGAANVAMNILSLGGVPMLCASTGNDVEADMMFDLLEEKGINTQFLFRLQEAKTTTKIRVMAQKHQLLRLDYEKNNDLTAEGEHSFLNRYAMALKQADVVILEDYNKGLLTEKNIPLLIQMARELNIPVCVDPKKKNFWAYKGVTLFKPNLKELTEALNLTQDTATENNFLDWIQTLENTLQNDISFLTLSEKGVLIHSKKEHHFVPSFVRQVADVSGAGDTVISVAALCLAAGLDIKSIAIIANLAGGLVCEEPGVVPIHIQSLELHYQKLIHSHAVL